MGVLCTKDLHFCAILTAAPTARLELMIWHSSSLHWSARDDNFVSSRKTSLALSSRSRVTKSPREKPKRTYRRGFLRSTRSGLCSCSSHVWVTRFGEQWVGEDERRLECLRAYHPTGNGFYWAYGELVVLVYFIFLLSLFALLRDPPLRTQWESGSPICWDFVWRLRCLVGALDLLRYWEGIVITTASIWKWHEERHDLVCGSGFVWDLSGPRALVLQIRWDLILARMAAGMLSGMQALYVRNRGLNGLQR